jgi:hypothetical protein
MKFNWGHGLALGMVLFIAYIMFMVVQAINTDFNLETEDYYSKELKYQETIDKSRNYKSLGREISLTKVGNQIKIEYPNSSVDSGRVLLFRPSDDELDKKFEINIESNIQNINLENSPKGRYSLQIEWWSNGKGYYYEQNLML